MYRRVTPYYFEGVTLNQATPILVPEGDTVAVAIAAELAEEEIEAEIKQEETTS